MSIFWQSCPFGKVLQLVIQNSSTLPVLGQATTKMQSNRCTPSAALVPLWNAKRGANDCGLDLGQPKSQTTMHSEWFHAVVLYAVVVLYAAVVFSAVIGAQGRS